VLAFGVAALLVLPGTAHRSVAPDEPVAAAAPAAPWWRTVPPAVPLLLGGANATMVTLMAVAPPALHHHGWTLGGVGLLVSVHVAAMFGFAPVSGRLCDRFPVPLVATAGAVLSAFSVLGTGLLGGMHGGGAGAAAFLVLLGVAWNVQLVAGTLLLIRWVAASHRHLGEAAGEIVMGAGAGFGTLAAAPLLQMAGLPGVAVAAAVVNVASAVAMWRLRRAPAAVRSGVLVPAGRDGLESG
jgi:MFS family permease